MGWFPVFANFMDGEEFKSLTPTEKLLFWHLVSEFNRRGGEFYQSDLEIAKTLATSEKTIRRGRAKLAEMDLVKAIPGTRTKRNQFLATRYLWVRFATMKPEEDRFFAQIPRYTFQAMLHRLRKSRLRAGDVVLYICLSYWFWRNRGKNEDHRFFITKKDLQSLTNLKDASIRIPRIYEAFVFSDGDHLFNYQDEYHLFTFRDWTICADPEEDKQNRSNAEMWLKEINDSVTQEKQRRQLKVQQKTVIIPQKSNDRVSHDSLLLIFSLHYLEKYDRWPNPRGAERLRELEQNFGRSAIHRAINYYFTADTVPNGSGAKTRTLGNFITHIYDLLKLSGESEIIQVDKIK